MRARYGRWRCSYGNWHDLDETCGCAASQVDPAALPAVRPGTTYRFHVVDHHTLVKRAVLEHGAEAVI